MCRITLIIRKTRVKKYLIKIDICKLRSRGVNRNGNYKWREGVAKSFRLVAHEYDSRGGLKSSEKWKQTALLVAAISCCQNKPP